MAGRQRVELDIGDGGKYQGDVEEGVPHGEGRASFPGQKMEFRGLWASGLFFHGELKEGEEVCPARLHDFTAVQTKTSE